MGVKKDWSSWGCWRNSSHRGRNPAKLISALLRISFKEAYDILGMKQTPTGDDLSQAISKLTTNSSITQTKHVDLPEGYKLVSDDMPSRFVDYLHSRGYDNINRLAKLGIGYSVTGQAANRIIFPIWGEKNQLHGWTARSIYQHRIRYLSSGPLSVPFPYRYAMTGGKVLFIVEGPFDALRVNWLSGAVGYKAVCMYTKAMPNDCVMWLGKLAQQYQSTCLLLDSDAPVTDALQLSDRLPFPVKVANLKEGDPGNITKSNLVRIIHEVA